MDVELDVDIDWYFGCLRWISESVQVLFDGKEAAMVLTLIILKEQALIYLLLFPGHPLAPKALYILGLPGLKDPK